MDNLVQASGISDGICHLREIISREAISGVEYNRR